MFRQKAPRKPPAFLRLLSAFEESGHAAAPVNYEALAGLIGLNGKKLQKLASGWLPASKDLSAWREFRCITTTGQGVTVNCYLVWDEVSREAALFDTGWEAQPILDIIEQNALVLRHLFITHTHEDHIAALAGIREKFPKVKLHSSAKSAPVDQRNRANDFIHLGSLRLTNRDTPGHAEEGMTYIIGTWPEDAPHVAIVGDAIFAGSIGRGNQSWSSPAKKSVSKFFLCPAVSDLPRSWSLDDSRGREGSQSIFLISRTAEVSA